METKNIVVIGASKGIGLSLTTMLLEQGHQVYATYSNTSPALNHPNLHWQNFDVRSSETLNLPEVVHGLVYCPGNIALKPFNRFYNPQSQLAPADRYSTQYELEWQVSIGSLTFPVYPCRSTAESLYKLKQALGIVNSSFHVMDLIIIATRPHTNNLHLHQLNPDH
jgi:hypothetical protein